MKRLHLIAAALVCALLVPVSSTDALGRDADGSRMQARPLSLGSTATDRLTPPRDAVDWRYVRLKQAGDTTVSVQSKPSNVTVRVSITNAMGKSITRGSTSNGSYTTRRRLDPGLYYISVAAGSAASYSLTVK